MSTPVITVSSGHFYGWYNGLALGQTEDGWEIDIIHKGMVVTSEEWGETELDLINRGAQVRVRAILKEWDSPGLMAALWGAPQFAGTVAGNTADTFGEMFCVGESAVRGINSQGVTRAKPLVLQRGSCHFNGGSVQGEGFNHLWNGNLGTPSWSTSGPADVAMQFITFHAAILTPDSVSKINLNNKPRVVPVEFMAFLTDVGGVGTNFRFFTVTAS